jgi:PAS domain S-box-containing protein
MNTFSILHLEDSALDAELIEAELVRNGLTAHFHRVDREEEFCREVEVGEYDLILADYMVPLFGGLAALEYSRQVAPDTPFIFLSGMLGEDLAIETLKQGATDYVLKSRLDRLTPAIRRALREAENGRQRRQAENALQENEERLRLAVDSTRLGLWDFDPRSQHMRWCNRCREMLGTDAGSRANLRGFLEIVHPDDRRAVIAAGRKALSSEGGGEYAAEFRIIRRNDQTERWLASRGRAYFDGNARPMRFVGTTRDITEPRQAVVRVQTQAQQLRALADAATRINAARDLQSTLDLLTSEARCIVGARQAYAWLNAEAGNVSTYSCSLANPSPIRANDHHSPLLVEIADSLCGDVLQPCRYTQSQLEADPLGSRLVAQWGDSPCMRGWLAVPLATRDGQRLGLVQLSEPEGGEFTEDDEAILVQLARMASVALENARLYDELRDNDRRKDEFLAMLAHELRNPLSAITFAAELLSTQQDGQPEVAWSAGVVARQCGHLSRLIDDLLDVARITRGKIDLRKQRVDLSAVVRGACEIVARAADEKQHAVIVNRDGAAAWVDGDPTRIEQIVVNLLMNAVKYTDGGGRIDVSERIDGHWAVLTIRDTGIGIAPEMFDRIFDLFSQVGRSLDRSQGGLGIGLTIVQKLVALHGGTIQVQSDGPGHGSTFEVRLPLALAPQAPENPRTSSPLKIPVMRVLIVDDNQDSARATALLLRKVGHEVDLAFDGPDGLRQAESFKPDVVLLDIGLPGLDGFEVAARLRQHDTLGSVGLVAVSGYGLDGDRQRARDAGFDAHLLKPVSYDRLLEVLAGMADGRKSSAG